MSELHVCTLVVLSSPAPAVRSGHSPHGHLLPTSVSRSPTRLPAMPSPTTREALLVAPTGSPAVRMHGTGGRSQTWVPRMRTSQAPQSDAMDCRDQGIATVSTRLPDEKITDDLAALSSLKSPVEVLDGATASRRCCAGPCIRPRPGRGPPTVPRPCLREADFNRCALRRIGALIDRGPAPRRCPHGSRRPVGVHGEVQPISVTSPTSPPRHAHIQPPSHLPVVDPH